MREGEDIMVSTHIPTASEYESHSQEVPHSPLPWQPCESAAGEPAITDAGCNALIAIVRVTTKDPAYWNPRHFERDRDFILRAVNNHEALLAALKTLVYVAPENPFTLRDPRHSAWPKLLSDAHAAVAKAEE